MSLQQKNPLTFLWFGLGFALVVAFMFFFYNDINTKLVKTEIESVELNANQQQASVNGVIDTHAINLESMSNTLYILSKNPVAVAEYLRNLEKNLGIDTVIYVEKSGMGLLSNLKNTDVSKNEAFLNAAEGQVMVTSPYKSYFSGKNVIAAAHPINSDKGIVGVVLVEFSIDYIKKSLIALVDEADEKGYSVLIDGKGEVICSTSYKDEYLAPFSSARFEDGLSYKQHLVEISKRKPEGSGMLALMGKEKRILEYRPINLRDWSIVVVSDDVSDTLIRSISEGIQILLIFIVISFFIFLASTIYLKRKGVKDIESVAFYDELTGLSNLVSFREQMKETLKKNPTMKFVIQKMDIKNFKAVNEMFGHDVGNRVIQKIAETVKTITEPTFICARIGADEFLMFSGNGFLEQDDAARENYEAYFKTLIPELVDHEFTFRYGRYFLEEGESNVMEIINKVNMAHHMAKVHNDKKIYEYDDKFKKRILRMAEINNKRKNAIENKEFKVYLQPKMNIFQNKICGAEALVRWIENDGKMVFPDEFIPLFEKNGFITHLDNYILRGVCRQIKIWLQAGYKVVPISVNFSRMHLQNPHFVQELKATCDSYGDIRQYIEVELTESAATENVDDLARILSELHEAGFSVAIDDFGAGYSSLGMLKNFTVDALKLDKSFFDENKDDSRGEVVVRGIIKVAKALGMKVVAEGIETAEQVEFLKSIQCEIVQGYYYARPMPLSEFEQSYMGEYNDIAQ